MPGRCIFRDEALVRRHRLCTLPDYAVNIREVVGRTLRIKQIDERIIIVRHDDLANVDVQPAPRGAQFEIFAQNPPWLRTARFSLRAKSGSDTSPPMLDINLSASSLNKPLL